MRTEKKAIRDVMYEKRFTQTELAEKAGFKSQSNINAILNNTQKGVRFDNLFKIFQAMGCEIVIRNKDNPSQEWVIDSYSGEEKKTGSDYLDSLLN